MHLLNLSLDLSKNKCLHSQLGFQTTYEFDMGTILLCEIQVKLFSFERVIFTGWAMP